MGRGGKFWTRQKTVGTQFNFPLTFEKIHDIIYIEGKRRNKCSLKIELEEIMFSSPDILICDSCQKEETECKVAYVECEYGSLVLCRNCFRKIEDLIT